MRGKGCQSVMTTIPVIAPPNCKHSAPSRGPFVEDCGIFAPAPSWQSERTVSPTSTSVPMTAIRLTPSSRSLVEHACALAAAAGLLASGAFAGAASVQAQTPATLKVMDWNIHHGVDTGGVSNLDRVVTWIVNINADVVSLNEVEKLNG